LRGHNSRASLVGGGGLEKDSWFVVDFSAVKKVMRGLTAELDHRVLLPRDNPLLRISEENGSVRVAFGGQPRYVFPTGDCVILPIANTTVEMLAQYLAGRVRAELGRRDGQRRGAGAADRADGAVATATRKERTARHDQEIRGIVTFATPLVPAPDPFTAEPSGTSRRRARWTSTFPSARSCSMA